MALKSLIKSFELELFHGSNLDGEPQYQFSIIKLAFIIIAVQANNLIRHTDF